MAVKYALPEIERRWFVDLTKVNGVSNLECRLIIDHFLTGTQLRLRRVEGPNGTLFKLGKKYGGEATNIYLNEAEYKVFAELPSTELRKKRYSLEGGSLDVPENSALAPRWEREFDSVEAAVSFSPPGFCLDEDVLN